MSEKKTYPRCVCGFPAEFPEDDPKTCGRDGCTDEPTPAPGDPRAEALTKLSGLIGETWRAHRDEANADYNGCDTAECGWCQGTREALTVIGVSAPVSGDPRAHASTLHEENTELRHSVEQLAADVRALNAVDVAAYHEKVARHEEIDRLKGERGELPTIYLVETGEYENRYLFTVAASLEAAVSEIKARFPEPYRVKWSDLLGEGDGWEISGDFEAVTSYSTQHTAVFEIEKAEIVGLRSEKGTT